MMVGRRSPTVYRELLGLPNVKLVNPNLSALDILQLDQCIGSVVISGTAGFESALLGKFSFIFSKLYYQDLPNCFYVRPEEITKKKIESAMSIPREEIDKRLIDFVAKLYSVSFKSTYASVWSLGKNEKIDEVFERAFQKVQEAAN